MMTMQLLMGNANSHPHTKRSPIMTKHETNREGQEHAAGEVRRGG